MSGPYMRRAAQLVEDLGGTPREQPTSLDVRSDIARGLNLPRGGGPETAFPQRVRPVGPFGDAEDTKFGRRDSVLAETSKTILQIEGNGAKETAACGLVIGYLLDPNQQTYAFPFAEVMFGVAGGSVSLTCDVMLGGGVMNMPSTSVRVTIFHPLVDPDIANGAAIAPIIQVFAFLDVHGGLSRPGTSNPLRRTIFYPTLTPAPGVGSIAQLPIPDGASSFQIGSRVPLAPLVGGYPLADLNVVQGAVPLANSPVYQQSAGAGNIVGGAIPIASGARVLRLENTNALLSVKPVVIYYLSY
jgi:hypothetical protein